MDPTITGAHQHAIDLIRRTGGGRCRTVRIRASSRLPVMPSTVPVVDVPPGSMPWPTDRACPGWCSSPRAGRGHTDVPAPQVPPVRQARRVRGTRKHAVIVLGPTRPAPPVQSALTRRPATSPQSFPYRPTGTDLADVAVPAAIGRRPSTRTTTRAATSRGCPPARSSMRENRVPL